MQKPKLRNHVVTRGYLTNWLSRNSSGDQGIWYFDLPEGKVKFSPGKKASFAIKKSIYAPLYAGPEPDDRLENWFAEYEGDMCEFIRTWSTGALPRIDAKRLERALIGCISLGYRSDYGLEEIERMVAVSQPEYTPHEARLAALNNCYSMVHGAAKRFTRGMSWLIHGITPALRTNDQPFLDMSPTSPDLRFATFPLTPTSLIIFFPDEAPPAGDFGVRTMTYDPKLPAMADFVRLAAMRTARRWVVCQSRKDADAVASYLTEERIAEMRSSDRPLLVEAEARNLFKI